MKIEHMDLGETGYFSPFFLDYLSGNDNLKLLYEKPPTIESFSRAIEEKNFAREKRNVLVKVLKAQYAEVNNATSSLAAISKLENSNCYTVTTGHQLNIFTGPLFFIYKIVTVINLAKKLKEQYPENDFLPVYWMASEDHDFEEINNFRLFGNKYIWETDQKGAVGEFNPNGLAELADGISDMPGLFQEAYSTSSTLSDAVRKYVHALFGDQGLIVIDANDGRLKSFFKDVIKDDVFQHHANDLVEKISSQLQEWGYSTYAFPRKINFFYKNNGIRERIIRENDEFKVLNTDLSFSAQELTNLIDQSPEVFSPNVILRPVYQETILPNLAYIGGPAEIAYWLQISPVFKHFQVPFPVLIPRNFGLIIPKSQVKKIQKLGFENFDFFKSFDELKTSFLHENSENEIDLASEKSSVEKLFDQITAKVNMVDKSLEGAAKAEQAKLMKGILNLEKRMKKSEERTQETSLRQIEGIYDKLFPNGNLQERTDNFLNFYINDPAMIDELLAIFDPFDFRFYVISDEA